MNDKRINKLRILLAAVLIFCAALCIVSCGSTLEQENEKLREIIDFRLNESDYTAASFVEYKAAYEQAYEVYNKEEKTVLEIDRVIDRVNAAKNQLVKKNDFSELERQLEIFKTVNEDEYSVTSYQNYKQAYDAGKKVMSVDSSSQSDINFAAEALDKAKQALYKMPDMTELHTLLTVEVDEARYTADSYAKYKAAAEKAEELLSEECPSVENVRHVGLMLNEAILSLVERGNTEKLAQLVSRVEAEVLVNDAQGRRPGEHYSAATFERFKQAYDHAKALIAAGNASDNEYDAAERALQTAVDELADISELIGLYDQACSYAKAVDRGDYTAASAQRLAAATDRCLTLRNDPNATKTDVERAVSQIKEAINRLEFVPIPSDGAKDKELSLIEFTVGNAKTTVAAYLANRTPFFQKLTSSGYDYSVSGGALVLKKRGKGELKITMSDLYLLIEYTGPAAIADTDLLSLDVSGVKLDTYVRSLTEIFGVPTDYSTHSETVGGAQKSVGVLVYENEAENQKLTIRVNLTDEYILSFELNGQTDA